MPLTVYMDVHIPRAQTDALRRRGENVFTSQEDGTAQKDDTELLARATELGRLLFTPGQDFLSIAAEWQRQERTFPGILFAAQQGASLGLLADDVEVLLTCCDPGELRDRVTYLPLR